MKPKSEPLSLKEQFAQAKILIDRKQYDHARELLRAIDHPTAQEWLAKLDKIAPEKPKQKMTCGQLAFLIIAIGIIIYFMPRGESPTPDVTATVVAVAATTGIETKASSTLVETATPTATITETPVPSATLTETPTLRPTDDIDAMAATGEAAINPIRASLEQFSDFQGLRSLSGFMLSNGISVNIDANVAPADDSEYTMWRVSELVQGLGIPVSQIRVNTYSRDQNNSLWLWEAGKWSVTRLATGLIEEYSAPPAWMATPTAVAQISCPQNCDEAVALGLSEQQAGKCSNLDRDGDGVACYGD